MTTSHTLICDPTAPQQARAWAQGQLTSAPAAATIPDALAEDVLLCISELVTNALQASCDTATLGLAITSGRVRVVVTDNGQGWPTPQQPGPSDPSGRGLLIISAIADRWGVEPAHASKTVWAELAV
jgi:signal transduction histidine kinase